MSISAIGVRSFALVTAALALLWMAVPGDTVTGSQTRSRAGKPNHLVHEKSPYLLQHAYNPVDWYPWGEEAFRKARKEDKPIFLSIGYSTCHWCHVMERESFSDPKIAAIMNEHYVSIKVDREERPDVDRIYMTAVQALTGGGGWPLSAWLTPDLKPFFGGTYFPPDDRWGRPGFAHVLENIAKAWKEDRKRIEISGDQLSNTIRQYMKVEAGDGPAGPKALDGAFEALRQIYDAEKGGFGGAPKFPMPVRHNFLLRYYARTGNEQALEISLHTLREMARGGIYDHLGGGFHRYSTDAQWHVPHFEKMLYDNSQLAVNYLEAYQISKDPKFMRVARETLDYVLRDMTHPDGGFYSAEDADSLPPDLAGKVEDTGHEHRTEGAFYIWEKDEILKALGEKDGNVFCHRYGVRAEGNAAADPHGEFTDKNILYAARSLADTAKEFGLKEEETRKILENGRHKLLEIRSKRPRPHLDDKILVSWNGLMISAMARAAQITGEDRYLKAAGKAADFIRKNLYESKDKRLYRRWRDGEKKITGIADDYAFLVQGLLDLYEASFDKVWLDWAIDLTGTQNELFYDSDDGGFYMTSPGHDKNLLVRAKEDSDNVEPSASSVAALNLLRLNQFTDRKEFEEAALKTLAFFGSRMEEHPSSLAQMLVALDYSLAKPRQIIIAGDPDAGDTEAMLRIIHERYIPAKILMVADGGESQRAFARWLPFLEGVKPIDGKATAYVCVDYTCELPTNDLGTLKRILDGERGG